MSEIIHLSNVRLSFPHIVNPQVTTNDVTQEQKSTYRCDLIMEPSHPGFAKILQQYAKLAEEQWKEKANATMQHVNADKRSRCFGKGEECVKKTTFEPYEGYVGNVYITATRPDRPQIIQANGQPIPYDNAMLYMEHARKLYGGCRVNVAVKLWLQKPNPVKKYGPGVRCELIALQFFKDDAPFGKGADDVSLLFEPVEEPLNYKVPLAEMPLPPTFDEPPILPPFLR